MDSSSSAPEVSGINPPPFQSDPDYQWWQAEGKNRYGYLMNGLTENGQSLGGGLGEATNISPEISRLSQQYAKSQLDPRFRQNRQNTINTLEANGQLTGSTTANALANLDSDYMASLTGMQAQYGLADVNRALQNRVSLFGTGLNLGQNIGANGLQNQQQMNNFALSNYENMIAQSISQAPPANQGSWMNSLMGGLGGMDLGGMLGGMGGMMGGGGGGYANNAGQAQSSMNFFGSKSNGIGSFGLGAESTSGTSSYAPNSYYTPLNSSNF